MLYVNWYVCGETSSKNDYMYFSSTHKSSDQNVQRLLLCFRQIELIKASHCLPPLLRFSQTEIRYFFSTSSYLLNWCVCHLRRCLPTYFCTSPLTNLYYRKQAPHCFYLLTGIAIPYPFTSNQGPTWIRLQSLLFSYSSVELSMK